MIIIQIGDIVFINDPNNKDWHGLSAIIQGYENDIFDLFSVPLPFWTYKCHKDDANKKLIKV